MGGKGQQGCACAPCQDNQQQQNDAGEQHWYSVAESEPHKETPPVSVSRDMRAARLRSVGAQPPVLKRWSRNSQSGRRRMLVAVMLVACGTRHGTTGQAQRPGRPPTTHPAYDARVLTTPTLGAPWHSTPSSSEASEFLLAQQTRTHAWQGTAHKARQDSYKKTAPMIRGEGGWSTNRAGRQARWTSDHRGTTVCDGCCLHQPRQTPNPSPLSHL